MEQGYEFEDVLIVPRLSSVNSRADVDISISVGPLKLKMPIVAAPMHGIISADMVVALDALGAMGILHRFHDDYGVWYNALRACAAADNWGAAVGLNHMIYRDAISMGCPLICIDVANGYLYSVAKYVSEVAKFIQSERVDTLIMAGNVVTIDGVNMLTDAGASIIRVGIGSGSLCITRDVTGIGVPQLTAIQNCDNSYARCIIADGGIRTSGDIVKAIAAGADLVMIGSLFAKAFESANGGTIYGMASKKMQEEHYHETKSIEGIEQTIAKTTSLEGLVTDLAWGIKSACTYLNAHTLEELQNNAIFIQA